jgi:hypothetical protein|tara:strand:- start:3374 stop:3751 length:378 start_codon:yes stop_codon:yes gene_type:complete
METITDSNIISGNTYSGHCVTNTDLNNNLYISSGGLSLGTTSPSAKLEITNNKIYKTMEKQVKVIVVKVTRFKKSGLIKTSTVINEGWLARNSNMSLELQAVKHFQIPIADLDNILVKEVVTVNL